MSDILALDIGKKRIGVARASQVAKLPEALPAIINDENVTIEIDKMIKQYSASVVVIGLPRNLSGDETPQSAYTRSFVKDNIPSGLKIVWQDETLSSNQAKNNTGREKNIDSEAACIILDDYLGNN